MHEPNQLINQSKVVYSKYRSW